MLDVNQMDIQKLREERDKLFTYLDILDTMIKKEIKGGKNWRELRNCKIGYGKRLEMIENKIGEELEKLFQKQ